MGRTAAAIVGGVGLAAKTFPILVALIVATLVPRISAAGASDEWIDVTAEAGVREGDRLFAWRAAKAQALEEAVEVVAARLVADIRERNNYQAQRDRLVEQDTGLVTRYEVVDTACHEDVCRVMLRVLVARSHLSMMLAEMGLLRVEDGEGAEPRWVRLEIEGLSGYGDLLAFQSGVQATIEDIIAIRQSRLDGSKAQLELSTAMSTQRLAVELTTRDLAGVSVRVTSIDGESVGVRLDR